MSQIVVQKYPMLHVEGDTYPPPAWRANIVILIQFIKYAVIMVTVSGFNIFQYFGYENPSVMVYAQQNKVSFCLMIFLLGNLVEGQLLSTGAFEIYLNDMPIWSKLESNRFPQPIELLQIIEPHLKLLDSTKLKLRPSINT